MLRVRLLVLSALTMGILACTGIGGGPALPEGIDKKIQDGDWATAQKELLEASKANPDSVEVATYLAFTQMMSGEYEAADKTLEAAEKIATEAEKPEIRLRRALIGLRTRDMDAVREHAKASGLPEGKLLAAEVHIVDLEADAARPLLQEIANEQTVVGDTASKYLEMLDQGALQEGLAEVTALWALGDRSTACDHASEIIPDLDDGPEKSELQLLWASRALTSGKVGVANALVSEILELPSKDQAWRLQATKAQIAIAEGEYEKGIQMLDQLEGGAPADGLADARATACALAPDQEVALQIAGDLKSNAIAWCLEKVGAHAEAREHAVEGTKMKDFLESQ